MKQNKPFFGALSVVKAFLFVSVLSVAGLSASAQTQIPLSITGVTESVTFFTEKVYDGTTALPVVAGATLVGVQPGDTVDVITSGAYDSRFVGDTIGYTISFTLTGPQAANYTLDTVVRGTNGRITKKTISVSGTVVNTTKVYDGTTICSVPNFGEFTGCVTGDDLIYNVSAAYLDVNVGANKQVVVVYNLYGTHAANYKAPATDSIHFHADITPRPIHIAGTAIDSAKIYDGTTVAQVVNHGTPVFSEVVATDTLMPVAATANYLDKNVGDDKPIVVTYVLNGPQASNYIPLNDSSLVADIIRRPITVGGAVVSLCKEYDGNTDATVLTGAEATNLAAGDIVPLATTAFYDTPDTGHNKTIYMTVAFADNGADQLNYTLPDTTVYSHVGKIILPTQLDENGLYITTDGTCQGDNVEVNYHIAQGEPVVYYITFPPELLALGFTNADSVALPATEVLPIVIPDGCPFGHYTCEVTFVNEAGGRAPYTFAFTVNYSNDYITDIFDDVVSIVNVENLFSTYQWYHNGVAIDGATMPYYQEEGGLTGTYYVRVNRGTATEGRTCEKTFNNATAKTVKVSPNPVSGNAKVILHGFEDGQHLLVVYNAYGQQILSRTFSGNECSVDFSDMAQGTYLLSVDGEKAKAIKF